MFWFVLLLLVAFVVYAMVKHYASADGANAWEKFLAALAAAGAALWAMASDWVSSIFG